MSDETPKFEIEIKTKADLEAARALRDSLREQRDELKKLGEDATEAEQHLLRLNKAIARSSDVQQISEGVSASVPGQPASPEHSQPDGHKSDSGHGEAHGIGEKLAEGLKEGLGDLASEAGIGPLLRMGTAAGAVAGGFAAATESVIEFAKAEKSVTKLDAALAQTGQLTEKIREQYQGLADELQSKTGVAGDQWLEVMAHLTQFGAKADGIDAATEAVKNLAGILNGDLEGSAQRISRALEGNFTWASRLGITFDDDASHAQKLNKLFEELAARGGGQLEARAQTLSGTFGKVKENFGDLLKHTGKLIVEITPARAALQALADTTEFWSEKIGSTIPKIDDLDNAQRAWNESTQESERLAKKHALALESEKQQLDAVARAIDHARQAAEERRAQKDEEADANMALKLAGVDQLEKRGIMPRTKAIRLRQSIRAEYDEAREKNAIELAQKKQEADMDEARVALDRVSKLTEKVGAQGSRISNAKQKERIEGQIRDAQEQRERAEQELKKPRLNQQQAAAVSGGQMGGGQPETEIIPEQLRATIDSAEKLISSLTSKLENLKDFGTEKNETEELNRLKDDLREAINTARNASQKAAESAQSSEVELKAKAKTESIRRQTTGVQNATEVYEGMKADVDAAKAGKVPQVPTLDPQMRQLQAAITESHKSNTAALKSLINTVSDSKNDLEAIRNQVEKLASQFGKRAN